MIYTGFHIRRFGKTLCHACEGISIDFDDAAGMNADNCCPDCRRRYLNLAKMLKLTSAILTTEMVILRAKTGENNLNQTKFYDNEENMC